MSVTRSWMTPCSAKRRRASMRGRSSLGSSQGRFASSGRGRSRSEPPVEKEHENGERLRKIVTESPSYLRREMDDEMGLALIDLSA